MLTCGILDGDGLAVGVDVGVRPLSGAVGSNRLALLQSIVRGENVVESAVVTECLLVHEDGRRWGLVGAVVEVILGCAQSYQPRHQLEEAKAM